jgi:hypothetical protein
MRLRRVGLRPSFEKRELKSANYLKANIYQFVALQPSRLGRHVKVVGAFVAVVFALGYYSTSKAKNA